MLFGSASAASTRQGNSNALFVALAAAAVIGVGLVAVPLSGAGWGVVVPRLIVITLLCLAPLVVAVVDRRVDLLSPIVLIGCAFFAIYALRGWALYDERVPGLNATFRIAQAYDAHFSRALDLAILGIVGFYAGYLWTVGGAIGRGVPRPHVVFSRTTLRRVGLILLAVGVPASLIAASQNQGVLVFGALAQSSLGEPLFNVAAFALVGFVLVALSLPASRRDARRQKLFLAATLVVMLGAGLVSAEKANFLWVLVALAAVVHYGYRKLRPMHVIVGLAIFAFLIFPAVQNLRRLESEDGLSFPAAVQQLPNAMLHRDALSGETHAHFTVGGYMQGAYLALTTRLNGLDALMLTTALTPSVFPYLSGSTYQRLPASFVPRAIWPGKPGLSLSQWFGDRYWGRIDAFDQSTQPVSFMGELYLNFGVPAVFFGMFLLGLMYRAWYTYLFRWRSPVAVAIYVAALPAMLQIEGDFVLLFRTGINRVVTSAVAIALLAYLVRGTDKEPATTAQVTHAARGRLAPR